MDKTSPIQPVQQSQVQDEHRTSHTTWKFYLNTKEIIQAMTDACKSAKSSIYLEQFLFTPDELSQELLETLIEKAKNGVTVKCVFDSFGSRALDQSQYTSEMQKAGVKIKFFNWMFPYSLHSKSIWYFRNHRRLLAIDRNVIFTGGVCISKEMANWRETSVRIEGPVVAQAVKVFDSTWKRAYKKHMLRLGTEYKTGLDGFSYITQSPMPRERHLYYRLVDAIRQSKKYVYLTAPYFLPDRRLQRVMTLAKKRGVDVRVLVPKKSDHSLVDKGAHTYFDRLLSKGIKIYLYKDMIHAKTAVIDDDWSMVGTLNLDNVSLRYNFENAVISNSSLFTGELKEHFQKDLRNAEELNLEAWRKRPLLQKIGEILVWPIRKFL